MAKWCNDKSLDGKIRVSGCATGARITAQKSAKLAICGAYHRGDQGVETSCKTQKYSRHGKLTRVCREAGFIKVFEVGQYLVNPKSEPESVLGDNTKIRPSRDVLVTGQHGRHGI